MKTRAFRNSFFFAVGVVVLSAAALPQVAQSQSTDIAVLHSRVDNIDSTLARIDKRLDRMDKRFDRMDERLIRLEEIVIRLDERMSAMQSQNRYIFGPLLLLLVTAMFALLTKGNLWGVDRQPKASGTRRGGSAVQPQPAASPA